MRQLSTFISVQLCYLKVTMYIFAYSQAFAKLNLSWMVVAIIRLYLPPLHKEFYIKTWENVQISKSKCFDIYFTKYKSMAKKHVYKSTADLDLMDDLLTMCTQHH